MMCLGWATKPSCAARADQTVVPPAASCCPDISWFWVMAAAIGLGALIPAREKGQAK